MDNLKESYGMLLEDFDIQNEDRVLIESRDTIINKLSDLQKLFMDKKIERAFLKIKNSKKDIIVHSIGEVLNESIVIIGNFEGYSQKIEYNNKVFLSKMIIPFSEIEYINYYEDVTEFMSDEKFRDYVSKIK